MQDLKIIQNKVALIFLIVISGAFTGLFFSSFFYLYDLSPQLLIFTSISFGTTTLVSLLIFIKYSYTLIKSFNSPYYIEFNDKEVLLPYRLKYKKVSYKDICCFDRVDNSIFLMIKGKRYRINNDTRNSLNLYDDELLESIVMRLQMGNPKIKGLDLKEDYLQEASPLVLLFVLSVLHIYIVEVDWFILLSFSIFIWIVNGIYFIPYFIRLQRLKRKLK
ncbi:MAG: hypothetical protein QM489_06020 [Candidatus Izemoplasma sp.]